MAKRPGRKAPEEIDPDSEPPEDLPVTAAVEPVSAKQPGYGEFEIDIEEVLRQTLPSAFSVVDPAPLNDKSVDNLPPDSKGAYLLFLDNRMVYAGKTDTRHGFQQRLGRHSRSVRHRVGLDPRRISFKALRIMVFSAFDVEAILISEMRRLDSNALTWNDSGFGSNDPGRRRDDSEPAEFDRDFPVDIDRGLMNMPDSEMTVEQVLKAAKAASPYLLRYGKMPGHAGMPVRTPGKPWTMRLVLEAVMAILPVEFQATVFHGRVVLYREHRTYEFAREVLRGQA
jgi:hypothetical protein